MATLLGVQYKLDRAVAHIHDVEQRLCLFRDAKPYTVRIDKHLDQSGVVRYAEMVAVKNHSAGELHPLILLAAGEAIHQMRSALDHLLHQLVILNGNERVLKNSRSHQFPICKRPDAYGMKACGMIYGVSVTVADAIADTQPYKRTPGAPAKDALWVLQDLNNTDKHRLIPATVVGIGGVRGLDKRGTLFHVSSPDVVLKDNEPFFRFTVNNDLSYDDVSAELTCAIAFAQAMSIGAASSALSIDTALWTIYVRVTEIVESFRPMFS